MEGVMGIWLPIVVAFAAASVAAVTDVIEFRVRNILTIPLIITGLVYHAAVGGWGGLLTSFQGMLFGFAMLIVPWLLGLMGGGDVKLLAGVGAWLGMPAVLLAFLVTSAATGIYAAILIAYRGKIRESLFTMKATCYRLVALGAHFGKEDLVEGLITGTDRRLRVIPFGAMVPLGIIGVVMWVGWLKEAF